MIHTGGQTGPRWRASLGKSGPKIPVFAFSFAHLSLCCRARALSAFIEPSIGRTRGNGGDSHVLFLRFRRLCVGERRKSRSLPLAPFQFARRLNGTRTRFWITGKQEDLVRLALKRLNVSYLTILSRLVWFQRERRSCVTNMDVRTTFAICFLEF